MTASVFVVLLLGAIFYLWYAQRLRRLALERLDDMLGKAREAEVETTETPRTVRVFPRRYRSLTYAAGVVAWLALWLLVGLPLVVSAAEGVLIGVLAYLVEDHYADQQSMLIEAQLAASIYLMVGSLRAGASLLAAFESALEEVGAPLRPYFQEVAGRIRLGDDPKSCVNDLQVYIPLETFRLFATSLAIHWEVGGSLATTLSTVGQTVRDRIELSRRVRAQAVESQASVAVVLVMAYALGFLMWRTNPDRLEGFVRTAIGTSLVAIVIMLQAVGLIWMSKLNRSSF
jgi:tight adherence protein B